MLFRRQIANWRTDYSTMRPAHSRAVAEYEYLSENSATLASRGKASAGAREPCVGSKRSFVRQ